MKSTAGESPTASASMRNSASRSQPSLLTGTKASLTPVMFSTAAISALATAAWETITARSGLLIVPLQVLLQLPRLSHALEQALVEPLGRVHAAVAQQVIHRHHLEHAFALADPGAAHEQEADAEHVGERAVHRGRGREDLIQVRLQPTVELRRLELGADHRDALGPRQLEQLGGGLLPFRDDHTRQVEGEEGLERAAARRRVERREIGDLGPTQDRDARSRGTPW